MRELNTRSKFLLAVAGLLAVLLIHLAVSAPTASSGASIGAIESIEPILEWTTQMDGAIDGIVLPPELNKLNKYYELAFDIDPKVLIRLAAIRQLWIDQSQSLSIYLRRDKWTYQEIQLIKHYASILGIKTLYYLNSNKEDVNEICDSCS